MPERKRIIRRLLDTPATLTSNGGPRRLPPDLLRQASRRLQVMALLAAAMWIIGPVLRHLALHAMMPDDPRWVTFLPVDWMALGSCALSFALFWFLRRRQREPLVVVDLGLAYVVATAFALGVLMHWGSPPGETLSVNPMITWVGPFILIFAAIVPVPPWKMLAAGVLAAAMDPLGMVIWKAAGVYEFGPMRNLLLMHYPNFLMAGIAAVISRVVVGLGQQVSREREMGSYRLGELLGSGGMGEVYLATHRMLARPAAIKLIRPEVLASTEGDEARVAVARFRREAEAAARLRSPHTVELYDFGITEDGTLYTVMELLDGMTLQALVSAHGPLPAPRAIHLLRQVCESLEEAHAAGLVHRDIKPANIHVGHVGLTPDFVKVLDFGLVKSVTERRDHPLATAMGGAPGTPAYMAPEMVGGDPVDGRADLYALGCVAHYLLTGRLVFEAGTGIQMIARHLQDTPTAPSRRAPEPIPAALDDLVLRCLAKRPADRPESAAAVGRALADIEAGEWSVAAASDWWARHPNTGVLDSLELAAATGGEL